MIIEVNGIELHWHEAGEGEPLLWLVVGASRERDSQGEQSLAPEPDV